MNISIFCCKKKKKVPTFLTFDPILRKKRSSSQKKKRKRGKEEMKTDMHQATLLGSQKYAGEGKKAKQLSSTY